MTGNACAVDQFTFYLLERFYASKIPQLVGKIVRNTNLPLLSSPIKSVYAHHAEE
jgi:hypothetical protein